MNNLRLAKQLRELSLIKQARLYKSAGLTKKAGPEELVLAELARRKKAKEEQEAADKAALENRSNDVIKFQTDKVKSEQEQAKADAAAEEERKSAPANVMAEADRRERIANDPKTLQTDLKIADNKAVQKKFPEQYDRQQVRAENAAETANTGASNVADKAIPTTTTGGATPTTDFASLQAKLTGGLPGVKPPGDGTVYPNLPADAPSKEVPDNSMFNSVAGGVGGATLGGTLGYALSDPENQWRNAILGTVGGGVVGGLGTHLAQKYLKKSSLNKQANPTNPYYQAPASSVGFTPEGSAKGKLFKHKGKAGLAAAAIAALLAYNSGKSGGRAEGVAAGNPENEANAYSEGYNEATGEGQRAEAERAGKAEESAVMTALQEALSSNSTARNVGAIGGAGVGGVIGNKLGNDDNRIATTVGGGLAGGIIGGLGGHYLENYFNREGRGGINAPLFGNSDNKDPKFLEQFTQA